MSGASRDHTNEKGITIASAVTRLTDGVALSRAEACQLMERLLKGEASPSQLAAILVALKVRGETDDEIIGMVEGMLNAAVRIAPQRDVIVDLCGTGGDASGTFNISTAASLVVAAAGVAVAKHGNRAASSRCGSADVLEELGIPVDLAPERATRAIEEIGFAFLFAPHYHPAMKHVGPVRRELGIRTVFNIMGPLASPARVRRQLLGVFDDAIRPRMANVLRHLGSECAWVVHGEGGLDEISIAGETAVTVATQDGQTETRIHPDDAGVPSAPLEELKGGDAPENAAIVEAVLRGTDKGAKRGAVVLNAGAALTISGAASDLREGVDRACVAIDSGAAGELLGELRRFR